MLSHLRFHRRGHSNPPSPVPDLQASPTSGQPSPFFPEAASSSDTRPQSSGSSALPPKLPPIARVTTADAELTDVRDLRLDQQQAVEMAPQPERRQQMPRSPYNGDSGFIGGVALRNYRRDMEAQAATRTESGDYVSGNTLDNRLAPSMTEASAAAITTTTVNPNSIARPPPQPLRHIKATTSFATPTDLHQTSTAAVGRRPAGTRLASEQQLSWTGAGNAEPPKGKKGLPFLKNPMSTLLLRRKNNHNVPDLLPLPLHTPAEEPMYDPRIRGTRVHDFSAPRRKNLKDSAQAKVSTKHDPARQLIHQGTETGDDGPQDGVQRRQMSNASDSAHSGSASAASQSMMMSSSMSSDRTRFSVLDESSLADEAAPPVPPKDDVQGPSSRRSNSQASFVSGSGSSALPRAGASMRSTRSQARSVSGASNREMASALPRHMKSTSSRFSFDMIGAAKQEKLLEERHRQKEAERQVTDPPGNRDSRYDEFDDDGFDYDAMMDDDGLEERIPGVNADYEDDYYVEDDGYNDGLNDGLDDGFNDGFDDGFSPPPGEDNYSNFVFQSSNPASTLASPHSAGLVETPRDADGNAIGFAMTQVTPKIQNFSPSPYDPSNGDTSPGLGIQGISDGATADIQPTELLQSNPLAPVQSKSQTTLNAKGQDDLYFDDGMLGFEGEFAEDLAAEPEWDAAPFDESIFDVNDTDQYGRPVPGAFAQAQNSRRAANQNSIKRDSDMTSRFSAQSGVTHSTAHTSMSAECQPQPTNEENPSPPIMDDEADHDAKTSPSSTSMAAYQAALAAAAHEAVASGKFRRGESPSQERRNTFGPESPTTPEKRSPVQGTFEMDHDDSFGYENMDDFELDDEAYIAEANASALANDSDGWYGQEFGFYANPINQHHNLNNPSSSPSNSFGYANGGFFGPKGVDSLGRSTSGRIVCREPNLTPITERSEYSNRNSVMSNLGLPPFSSATPIQSPGLAQLAMMAERGDDQMSLSALLRLRSKAWGGSQPSITSSREGSPKSENSPWGPNAGHVRKNSVFSTMSRDSDAGSLSGSPTLTMGNSFLSSPTLHTAASPDTNNASTVGGARPNGRAEVLQQPLETNLPPALEPAETLSAVSEVSTEKMVSPNVASRRPVMGHRHKGSADSISYMQEEDSGERRWVMERRRTDEWGEVEILGREVVEGGRI